MKIGDNKPTVGLSRLRRTEAKSSTAPVAAVTITESGRAISDVTTIMGVPESELTERVRSALLQLMAEVDHLRRELEVARARTAYLEKLADEDALMPIANRRAFVRELSRLMSFAQRYGTPSSVVYFDINGMKEINDRHGHAAGDAALLHVARVLLDQVRNTDVVGRLGGDEFGVLLAQLGQDEANRKAHTLAEAIEGTPFSWNGANIPLRAAHGCHCFSGFENAVEALDAADRAMYERKRAQKTA
jgi:diguanylate cyclase (GGDEF)-like protein